MHKYFNTILIINIFNLFILFNNIMQTYTIVDYPKFNTESGRYNSKNPLGAAKKIFTKLEKNFSLKNSNQQKQYIEFTLRNIQTNK